MTTPRLGRTAPHPLVTLAGWVVLGLLIAAAFVLAGSCLAAVSDVVRDVVSGVKP